jgi:serine/threonine protein kinase
MELCSVGAVTDLMRVCQCTLNERQIAVVVRGALGALHYMHEKKGVHRDIKTDNILLSSRGEPKLGDFGVSRQLGAGESRMRTIAGTPYFIAPEILSSEQPGYNTKADIWSVGISIIEMAEGHPPYFDEHPMRVLFFIPTKPAPTLQDPGLWSPDMHDFLSLCLLKDPAERPGAAELLRHAWIAAAPDCTEAFGELIAQYDGIVAQYGSRAKALKALKKSDGKADSKESKAEKKKPSSKRDDKRQRRRERREKSRQKHSDDEGDEGDDMAVSGAVPPPPPRANSVPPPLPPDAPLVATKSAPVTTAATATATATAAAVESDDEHSHGSDEASDEGDDLPSNANADEQFVIDYSHGRPLIFDGHREDGRCWFDPRHQVWLSSPDENPERAKAASDRAPPSAMPPPPPKTASRGTAPPQMAAPGPPPGPPPVISARATNSTGDIISPRAPRPAVPAAMPAASRTSVGQLLAERPFKFFLPNGTFKTIVAHSNWSVMQLLTAAREKSGLTDQNILLVLRDPASRTRRVFDARERPLLMAESETVGMAFYIEVAASDGGGAAGSDKRRGLLSEIRGFALKKKP